MSWCWVASGLVSHGASGGRCLRVCGARRFIRPRVNRGLCCRRRVVLSAPPPGGRRGITSVPGGCALRWCAGGVRAMLWRQQVASCRSLGRTFLPGARLACLGWFQSPRGPGCALRPRLGPDRRTGRAGVSGLLVSRRECARVRLSRSPATAGAGPVVCRSLDALGCQGNGGISMGARLLWGDGWLIGAFNHRA